MFWNIFGKKKNKSKMPLVKSSRIWRELYTPQLFKLLSPHLEIHAVKEMYSLLFFLATDDNLKDCLKYIDENDYNKLQEMNSRVPTDFDEVDYPLYDLVYIVVEKGQYIGIVFDDGKSSIKNISLNQLIICDNIDLTKFLGRRLIYPI